MNNSLHQDYSKNHVQFYDNYVPDLVEFGFVLINEVKRPNIIDLGCGDGRLLFALHKKGFLNSFSEIVGVDISTKRIKRLIKKLPFVSGIVGDASSVKEYGSSFFDLIICSQVIEHVRNDEALINEIRRLLKNNGVAYISTVIKHWYAVYFYFKNGSFKLDPTHIREYSSSNEFLNLVTRNGFEIINNSTRQITFPLFDLAYRTFVGLGTVEPDASFFQKNKSLSKIRKLRIPIAGYETMEVLVKKK